MLELGLNLPVRPGSKPRSKPGAKSGSNLGLNQGLNLGLNLRLNLVSCSLICIIPFFFLFFSRDMDGHGDTLAFYAPEPEVNKFGEPCLCRRKTLNPENTSDPTLPRTREKKNKMSVDGKVS